MRKLLSITRMPREKRRRAALRLARRFLADRRGGEVLEYSLVAGLIVVGAIGAITCVGTKLVSRWTSLNSSI